MSHVFARVDYDALNSRQREAYNFQKVSALLADYGFVTIRLTSDWQGADFIAQHFDKQTFLKVQLKGRLVFDKKYQNQGLYVCFPFKNKWFMYLHDELLAKILKSTNVELTQSWAQGGHYSFPTLSPKFQEMLAPYSIGE